MATPSKRKPSLSDLGFYTPSEQAVKFAQDPREHFLIEGLIKRQSLALGIGESGLGKSPWAYQAAMCIAAGIPFCGLQTEKARVLYADNENGPDEVNELIDALARHLGLQGNLPKNLILYNKNSTPKDYGLDEMVALVAPEFIIVDPLNAWYPNLETRQQNVIECYLELRGLMRKHKSSFLGIHHPSKDPEGPNVKARPKLDQLDDVRPWFKRARGPSALINGCDTRIGFDKPTNMAGDCELIVGGFGRKRAAFPLMRLARAIDDEGEILGYKPIRALDLLKLEWQKLLNDLPHEFQFKDAKARLGNSSYETARFVKACQEARVVLHDKMHPPKGIYRKTAVDSGQPPQPCDEPMKKTFRFGVLQ